MSPSVAKMHVVGDISKMNVLNSLKDLENNWAAKDVTIPEYKTPEPPKKSTV